MPSPRLSEPGYLQDFAEELDSILGVVLFAGAMSDPDEGARSAKLSSTLLQSSLVLTVAQFEGFVKNLSEEFIDQFNRMGIPRRNVPDALVYLQTSSQIEDLLTSTAEERYNKLPKLREQLNLYWDNERTLVPGRTGSRGTISHKPVLRTMTSLNPSRFVPYLTQLGVDTSFCEKDLILLGMDELKVALRAGQAAEFSAHDTAPELSYESVNVKEYLEVVVHQRNTIAHGNGAVELTPGDMGKCVGFFFSLATILYQEMDNSLERMCRL